ncbi:outer membrane protein assembly factor BamB family protein [Paraliomyxa miuraensis]|uniref:outer membrane protein assembly factor BamB family protein n=1 Tax=Paraliomyxa miuraensis TaxID=376150 RepID=UPI00225607C7|nr:PQQ-binding-like beta-propeller repeat protein [Paraliomyxa miuraensis]MCX4244285.1 PQQ-like beta-propeller repeat protein [Paraliomyxa miuraensis]
MSLVFGRRASTALGLALLVASGACKKDEAATGTASTEADSPETTQRRECERFATDMAQTGALAGQILVTALDDDPESAREGRQEMASEARKLRQQLLDKCMKWPQEVMECLPPLGVLKDGCEERLLAALDGATPPPQDVPPGPSPAWSFTLESDPRALAVADDGTVVAVAGVESNTLVALRDGKVAWRKEGDFVGWLLPLPGEPATWITAEENRVLAIDPTTGAERWTASLPVELDGEGDEAEPSLPPVRVAAVQDGMLLVGDDEARFFVLDPASCGAAGPGVPKPGTCVTAAGGLPDEVLESDARLLVGAGRRLLWEDGTLRAFDAEQPKGSPPDRAWSPTLTLRPHDMLSHVGLHGDRLVLVIDDDVVELDAAQCRSSTDVAPSGWPQPGALRVEDECEGCSQPPTGCRRWRAYVEDVTGESPAVLDDGVVVVNADGYTLALDEGDTRWKASTGGGGPLATDGRRVFGFSTALREDDPPGVFELDASNGHLRWRTPLPLRVGDIYSSDDIRLVQRGSWLVVCYEQTIMALQPSS